MTFRWIAQQLRRTGPLRAAALGAVLLAMAPLAAAGPASATSAPHTLPCAKIPGTSPSVVVAPYIEVTGTAPNLAAIACATGVRTFSLAFFTGVATTGGCHPALYGGDYRHPALRQAIADLRALGGRVIAAFGGAVGKELALTCPTVGSLETAYALVLDYYGITSADFDVEGSAVTNSTANQRRDHALVALPAVVGHRVAYSFTLYSQPAGLPPAERTLVAQALSLKVPITAVNAMTMDFGDTAAPHPAGHMGSYAIAAINSVVTQLHALRPTLSLAAVRAMVGATPMIGQNDQRDEIFTTTDAKQLATWAKSAHLGRLAFWSSGRDRQCSAGVVRTATNTCSGVLQVRWAYSKLFEAA